MKIFGLDILFSNDLEEKKILAIEIISEVYYNLNLSMLIISRHTSEYVRVLKIIDVYRRSFGAEYYLCNK
jgi:hypothetical protein